MLVHLCNAVNTSWYTARMITISRTRTDVKPTTMKEINNALHQFSPSCVP